MLRVARLYVDVVPKGFARAGVSDVSQGLGLSDLRKAVSLLGTETEPRVVEMGGARHPLGPAKEVCSVLKRPAHHPRLAIVLGRVSIRRIAIQVDVAIPSGWRPIN